MNPWIRRCLPSLLLASAGSLAFPGPSLCALEVDPVKPRLIPLDFEVGKEGRGSVLTVDLDGDGHLDFVVTAPDQIGAYRHDGRRLAGG